MGPLIRRAFSGVFPKHSLIALLACMFLYDRSLFRYWHKAARKRT
ncbi:hypothetical protein A676_01436 [Salmonella enterica subsp. enterica serovar Enteritidis str. 2010K-0262]|uniref:Uncharacterized protein n=1 Tax=Salmonella enteritidis (strain 2009K0958) TaxID=1192586 RepID=A0A656IJG9_SALE2|nr:hypothetical protein A673_02408 [Salmonella enterica subsp. enterica serovar Enteritidis str. 2009K0958]EPI87128.1 hypothetical protein A675_01812 [Salmonella enterica subsp. enterica serovar Enteritidis str. 2009K1726]EPI87700.1 hypothetical protein A674_01803 [Salmonella enterica subsp. enterica serovar Enteritidis str. 2009K1651]EPI88300.1 hypothetical protein A676_01436 [Salmonella enterica subsp. enterica serovar Enteritidis str. 2010K-0262]EPJ03348.1 hypothetical protein A677_00757 [Sa